MRRVRVDDFLRVPFRSSPLLFTSFTSSAVVISGFLAFFCGSAISSFSQEVVFRHSLAQMVAQIWRPARGTRWLAVSSLRADASNAGSPVECSAGFPLRNDQGMLLPSRPSTCRRLGTGGGALGRAL